MALVLTPRSVGLMVAAALAAGWMGASIAHNQPEPAARAAASGPRPLGTSATPRAENLRQRLSEPPLPARGRNPFVFGSRPAARPMRSRAAAPVEQPETPVFEPAAPPMPVFRLSGIASNVEGDTTVLTAILSDNGVMVFAKAGDTLSNGYRVVRVEETSVTLADAAGITQTIKLP